MTSCTPLVQPDLLAVAVSFIGSFCDRRSFFGRFLNLRPCVLRTACYSNPQWPQRTAPPVVPSSALGPRPSGSRSMSMLCVALSPSRRCFRFRSRFADWITRTDRRHLSARTGSAARSPFASSRLPQSARPEDAQRSRPAPPSPGWRFERATLHITFTLTALSRVSSLASDALGDPVPEAWRTATPCAFRALLVPPWAFRVTPCAFRASFLLV